MIPEGQTGRSYGVERQRSYNTYSTYMHSVSSFSDFSAARETEDAMFQWTPYHLMDGLTTMQVHRMAYPLAAITAAASQLWGDYYMLFLARCGLRDPHMLSRRILISTRRIIRRIRAFLSTFFRIFRTTPGIVFFVYPPAPSHTEEYIPSICILSLHHLANNVSLYQPPWRLI